MDKKKQWLLIGAAALLLVLVLVLCIASCSKEEQQENLPQIGLCLRQYEKDSEYGKLLQDSFQKAGYEVVIQDAKNDQTRQTEQVKKTLDQGVVLLVIEPVMADAAEDTVKLLMEKNVPAVFIGNKPENALEMWNRLSYVGREEESLGSLQGEIILQTESQGDLNEDGFVSCLILGGPEKDPAAKAQAEGCIDVLVKEGLLVDQIQEPWGKWTQESGRARCAKALSQYGRDIEVIFCGNEAITLGALEAIDAGGWQIGRDYLLVGVGAENENVTGTVFWDMEAQLKQILSAAEALMDEQAEGQEYYVNLKTVAAKEELE